MKRIYTLFFAASLFFTFHAGAQCPTPSGMVATPVTLSGLCFINVQFAIPNSNVSLYNASGYVTQGTANASGSAFILYPCGSNPITSIVSLVTTPSVMICNQATITMAITLPVKLTGFSASITKKETVLLKWETALEFDNDKFIIQRSTDGINFQNLAEVKGSGNSIKKNSYEYEDLSSSADNIIYYRLKQVDMDGTATISKVVMVNNKKTTGTITAFPNPITSSNNTIQLKGIPSKDVTYNNIRLTDMNGRKVSFRITGANAIEPESSLVPGIYILWVKGQVIKLMKN